MVFPVFIYMYIYIYVCVCVCVCVCVWCAREFMDAYFLFYTYDPKLSLTAITTERIFLL